MISLRQHAISLIAVFLALAVGVVLGSGLLSGRVLSGLRDDRDDLQTEVNDLQSSNNALGEQLNPADGFDAAVAGLGGCPFAKHAGAAGNPCRTFSANCASFDGSASSRAARAASTRTCRSRRSLTWGSAGPMSSAGPKTCHPAYRSRQPMR